MHRRKYLATISAGVGVALSGCAEVESQLASLGGSSRTVGEVATYEGVQFTPTKYLLTDSLRRDFGNGNSEDAAASSGATFILTYLSVVHEGDSEQKFPQNGMTTDDIDLYYDNDRVGEGMMDDMTDAYIVEDKRLKEYDSSLYDDGATSGVYPGTEANGWIAHEIAANFDPEKLELHVIWNNQPFMNSDEETTHEWTYSEDVEVSIDDVEGEDTTISM